MKEPWSLNCSQHSLRSFVIVCNLFSAWPTQDMILEVLSISVCIYTKRMVHSKDAVLPQLIGYALEGSSFIIVPKNITEASIQGPCDGVHSPLGE